MVAMRDDSHDCLKSSVDPSATAKTATGLVPVESRFVTTATRFAQRPLPALEARLQRASRAGRGGPGSRASAGESPFDSTQLVAGHRDEPAGDARPFQAAALLRLKCPGSDDVLSMAPLMSSQPHGACPDLIGSLCDVGHQVGARGDSPWRGLLHDKEFGLIHNRARSLHPRLGRFLQRDPLGYVDGMSLYEYVRSKPVDSTDTSGLWAGRDHRIMTESAFTSWFLKRAMGGGRGAKPTWSCREYMLKTSAKANTGQDWGAAGSDMRRHYNRNYIKDETDEDELSSRKKTAKEYQEWITQKKTEFFDDLRQDPPDCDRALKELGERLHSFQDFYGHAIRRDGQGGSEQSRYPGWTAWTAKPPVTGSPGFRKNFWPSSYAGLTSLNEGEHPNRHEPVKFSSPEGQARYSAALKYTEREVSWRLPSWWRKCSHWCNAK